MLGKSTLGADNALRNGWLRRKKCPCDFFCAKPAKEPKRQRHSGVGGQYGMAGDEHEAEKIIAHIVIELSFKIRHSHLLGLKLAAKFLVFEFQPRAPAEVIDSAMLGCGHEPGARIFRYARLRPLFERRDQSVLRQVFREANIAHHTCECRDEPGRFHSPDGIDGTV
jgi:hypothetical protein